MDVGIDARNWSGSTRYRKSVMGLGILAGISSWTISGASYGRGCTKRLVMKGVTNENSIIVTRRLS